MPPRAHALLCRRWASGGGFQRIPPHGAPGHVRAPSVPTCAETPTPLRFRIEGGEVLPCVGLLRLVPLPIRSPPPRSLPSEGTASEASRPEARQAPRGRRHTRRRRRSTLARGGAAQRQLERCIAPRDADPRPLLFQTAAPVSAAACLWTATRYRRNLSPCLYGRGWRAGAPHGLQNRCVASRGAMGRFDSDALPPPIRARLRRRPGLASPKPVRWPQRAPWRVPPEPRGRTRSERPAARARRGPRRPPHAPRSPLAGAALAIVAPAPRRHDRAPPRTSGPPTTP